MAKKKKNSTKKRGKTKSQLLSRAISILGKYHKGKFKSEKKQIRERAKTLLDELIEKGFVKNGKAHVTIKNINAIMRKHRQKKTPEKAPFIPSEMLEPESFFNVIDNTDQGNYISWIAQTSKDIEFRSKISPEPYNIFNGGDKVSYQTHFKDFADFANKILGLIREGGDIPTSDDAILIATTPPKKDKNGQWFSEIYTCDVFGQDQDYGFDPDEPKSTPKKVVTPSDDASSIISGPTPKPPEPEKPKAPEPEKPKEEKPGITESEKLKIESEERIRKAEIEAEKEVKLKQVEAEKELKVKQMKIEKLDKLLELGKIDIDRYLDQLGKI
jgi:hypothetical protein